MTHEIFLGEGALLHITRPRTSTGSDHCSPDTARKQSGAKVNNMNEDRLLRNVAGTARERVAGESVEELALEEAIARNVRQYRRHLGLSVGDMAQRIGISKAMLSKVENANTSCSLATLARLAAAFDVPVTSLFRGTDTERPASFVEAGMGTPIVRNGTQAGHEYQLLGALRGEHRRLECLLVTLSAGSDVFPLFQHPGTEFIYVLEGVMDYAHSSSVFRLRVGDSFLLDGQGAHGPVELVQLPIRFLSVIAFPESSV